MPKLHKFYIRQQVGEKLLTYSPSPGRDMVTSQLCNPPKVSDGSWHEILPVIMTMAFLRFKCRSSTIDEGEIG